MTNLYEIDSELLALLHAVENGEEVENVSELLSLNEDQHAKKLTGYAHTIQEYKARAESMASEIKRLQGRKNVLDSRVDFLKNRALQSMIDRGIDKMQVGTFDFTHKTTEIVDVTDVGLLPSDLVNITTTADKTKIKAAIKRGDKFEGATIATNNLLGIK